MIEELHRPLKSAIKCHATERWTEVLPIILLGLRASLKEDILCTPAELVFGTTIRLPGEMFDSSKPDDDVVIFVSKLKSHMQSLHPKPPKHHGKRPVFIHPGLLEATHVFLRRDMLRRPLQQPYDGPFKVLQRKDKVFSLTSMNETPATVEPNATASTPATVESDPTASTPTQGCGSPVVKVSNHGRHVMSSIPVPLKTRRVGQRCTLNLSRAETSSRWCGVVVRRGGASSGVVHVT
ncbi:integrase catalytic domain-containing protein [Trichonephila clavipes]|nr:integrase catalytic domain-containing protein [Trichonephila clavipes]